MIITKFILVGTDNHCVQIKKLGRLIIQQNSKSSVLPNSIIAMLIIEKVNLARSCLARHESFCAAHTSNINAARGKDWACNRLRHVGGHDTNYELLLQRHQTFATFAKTPNFYNLQRERGQSPLWGLSNAAISELCNNSQVWTAHDWSSLNTIYTFSNIANAVVVNRIIGPVHTHSWREKHS